MRYAQPQSGPVQIDPTIGADFAWCAPVGRIVGPSVTPSAASGRIVTPAGVGLNSGYAVVGGQVPSMHATTWTECGVVLLDGTNQIFTLSARNTGQTVNFVPLSNKIDVIIWGAVDVNILGTLPVGIVHYVVRRAGSAHTIWLNGKLYGTATAANTPGAYDGTPAAIGAQEGGGAAVPLVATNSMLAVLRTPKALPDAQCLALSNNHWQLFRSPQRVMLAAAGGTNTPVNPGVGALVLTGYSPAVAQSANQSLTPGAGSIGITGYAPSISQPQAITAGAGALTLTGYAPTVTQGITTSIVPGAGALNLTGYAPIIAQSANQSVMPNAGSLSIGGYAPAIAQTANQSVAPVQGSLTITGYAPTVAQALASPNLVPEVGALSITGYAPTVEQSAPITKIGGDDAPRHDEEDERVEVWEKRAPTPRRDDSLDKVIREAYAKAIAKPAAPAVAKAEPKPVALDDPAFDVDEEDDLEVLLLSL